MPSLNCHECPNWDSETMETYYDCDAAYECAECGNPFMDEEDDPAFEWEEDEAEGRAIII